MAANIPLGTFQQDGVRTGPLYSGQIPSNLLPFNPSLDLSYSAYSSYGPGILLSAQNTWNITPAQTNDANIIATTNAIADINNLVLTGDNVATKLISQSNTPTYVQFDWPRVPVVTVSDANLTGPLLLTIFGFDWYGNPMQHTYTIQDEGTYPSINMGSLSIPAKAFYSVSQVSISSDLTNGASISIGAGDIFGLPFRVNNAGDITSIGWGNNSDLQNNSGLLASPTIGVATLVAGTADVINSSVTATSNIQVTRNTPAGALGELSAPTGSITPNVGFVINSASAGETSTINWEVINPSSQYTASGEDSGAMVAGVVTVHTSQVSADSNIQLTMFDFGTAHGQWYVSNIVPGVSFTVTSTDNTETSKVSWAIMPSNWLQGKSNALGSGVIPVAGEFFVNAPAVRADSNILLTYATDPTPNGGILSAPSAMIQPGIGFTIVSSNNADTAQVNWAITNLMPNFTQGTATLVAGTVTVNTTAINNADNFVLLSYNTLNTPATAILVSAVVNDASFTITAQQNTDVSSVNWAIIPKQFFLPNTIEPLGTFVPGDQTFPPSATTGDVRGLYAPSSPSNGVNVLRFTSYVQGADQWINQVANNQFTESTLGQPTVGIQIDTLDPDDLVGFPQFYTGNNS